MIMFMRALKLQYESEIDLIVTDVNMPIVNGLEMIRKILNFCLILWLIIFIY